MTALSLGDGTEVSRGTECCFQVTLCTWRFAPALNSPKTPRERLSHPKPWDVPHRSAAHSCVLLSSLGPFSAASLLASGDQFLKA